MGLGKVTGAAVGPHAISDRGQNRASAPGRSNCLFALVTHIPQPAFSQHSGSDLLSFASGSPGLKIPGYSGVRRWDGWTRPPPAPIITCKSMFLLSEMVRERCSRIDDKSSLAIESKSDKR